MYVLDMSSPSHCSVEHLPSTSIGGLLGELLQIPAPKTDEPREPISAAPVKQNHSARAIVRKVTLQTQYVDPKTSLYSGICSADILHPLDQTDRSCDCIACKIACKWPCSSINPTTDRPHFAQLTCAQNSINHGQYAWQFLAKRRRFWTHLDFSRKLDLRGPPAVPIP